MTEVGTQHLGPVEMALRQLVDRHFGGNSPPHQIVEVRVAGQGLLHQGALDLAAVVAAGRGHQLDGAPPDGIGKAGLDHVVATAALGAREQGHRDGLAARRVTQCQPVPHLPAHLIPGDPHLGPHQAGGQIVDQAEYRQRAGGDCLPQPLIAHGAKQNGVAPLPHALLQLLALLGQGTVAPRLVDPQADPQPCRLFHHALIDRQPVGVPQMGIEGAQGEGTQQRGGLWPVEAHRLAAESATGPVIHLEGEQGAREQHEQQGEIDASHDPGFC
ncbi:hypothetical protein D3C84_699950 [compost metagenome]